MSALTDFNFILITPEGGLKATILSSLLSAWVLIGLFFFLNRYTRRQYFTIWTAGWLFYVVWLALNLFSLAGADPPAMAMAKEWCLASVAVFLLWGSVRFIGLTARTMSFGLFLLFLFVWSYVDSYHLEHSMVAQASLFALIGGACVVNAISFFRYRQESGFIGAGLLSVGFLLWGLFLTTYPFIQGSEALKTAGFFISAILQLFIAVSMIILVLEEVKIANQLALERIESCKSEETALRSKISSTEERYRHLFAHASEGIVIAAATDLRIIELNNTAERLLGLSHAEAQNQILPAFCRLSNINSSLPGDSAKWVATLCQQGRLTLISKNGGSVAAEASGASVEYKGNAAYQLFFREMTERSRLEQQLRQAEKLSALGQMISGVAHELNNPLAVVKGYLELILAHHDLNRQTRADLGKVTVECNRAVRLVQSFLAFARDRPSDRHLISFNEIIERIVALRRSDFMAAGVKLELDLFPALPCTAANTDQIQQLIVNIVQNAIQAMAEAPGKRILKITTSTKENKLILARFEDSGPGVPPELESRIFEPFFSTKQVGSGTGLGLSIAHTIVADHDGRIYCHRSSLGGAGFFIEIPIKTAEMLPAPNEAPEPSPSRNGNSARVLVLDDEQSIAEMLSEMLTILGHQPSVCISPVTALELIDKREFDVILSDFRMPGMNGEEFYQRVKQKKPGFENQIIFLSGDLVNERTQHFLNSTGNLHLGKPFQLSALGAAVSKLLAKTKR